VVQEGESHAQDSNPHRRYARCFRICCERRRGQTYWYWRKRLTNEGSGRYCVRGRQELFREVMRPERRVHLWVRLRAEWLLGQLYDLSEPKDRRRAYDPRYCIRNCEGGTFTRASKCSHTIDHRVSETRAAVAYLQPLAARSCQQMGRYPRSCFRSLPIAWSGCFVVLLYFASRPTSPSCRSVSHSTISRLGV
jgi:hypothetical protein